MHIEDMTVHNLNEEASNAAKANNCDVHIYFREKIGLGTNLPLFICTAL
jgi:hypothetical protein